MNPKVAELLPREPPARRPFPWRASLLFFLPAAALAAGTGLQRFWEGPLPAGDAVLRWLFWSAGAGLVLGTAAALMRRRWAWAAYGAIGPFLAAALVSAGVRAVLPAREWLADRREAACRESGRRICTVSAFRAACARGDAGLLGPASTRLCDGSSCTSRWLYQGPFRPESYVAPGSLLCSVVTDASGKLARASLTPAAPRD